MSLFCGSCPASSLDWILKPLPLPPHLAWPVWSLPIMVLHPSRPWLLADQTTPVVHSTYSGMAGVANAFALTLSRCLFELQFQSSAGHVKAGSRACSLTHSAAPWLVLASLPSLCSQRHHRHRAELWNVCSRLWGLGVPESFHPDPRGQKCSDYSCQMV